MKRQARITQVHESQQDAHQAFELALQHAAQRREAGRVAQERDAARQRELIVRSAALLENLQAHPEDLDSHVALVYVLLELKRHHAAQNVLQAAARLEKQCRAAQSDHARMIALAEARSSQLSL